MRKIVRIVAAVSVAATVVYSPVPSRAAFLGDNGPIVYRGANTRFGFFTVGPDGANEVQLIDLRFATKPDWSPDGSQIAFESEGDIFVMDSDGTNIRNITNSPDATDGSPAWDPNGTRIVFDSARPSSDIFVMNADGTGEVQLTTDTRFDAFPQWSPDGETISWAASRGSTPGRGIFTMPADTGEPETFIAPVTYNNPDHDWSPDGTRIVFDSAFNIFTVGTAGGTPTQLTQDGTSSFGVSWSPDGTKIAYRSDRTGAGDIYVMDVDGSNQTLLAGDPRGNDTFPDWGPARPVPGCDPEQSGTTCGTGGNDAIDVTVDASAENFVVQTGDGADTVELHIADLTDPATVTIQTGDGGDTVIVPPSAGQVSVRVETGLGNDVVRPSSGSASARLAAQGTGALGYVVLTAGGNDRVKVGGAGDRVSAGAGKDEIDGAGGSDTLGGGGGGDDIEGGAGRDRMNGGGGTDVLHGSDGKNLFNGGSGRDTCLSDTKLDRFRSCERIRRNHRRNHQQA